MSASRFEKSPTVSVVMANYNGEPFLQDAVASILTQTFEDFEFIVVDDCSTDGGYDYLSSLDDARMVILRNEKNLGQTASLNIGLRHARGEFIARMDSDDVSLPARFERQVAYLRSHADIDILGAQATVIDADGRTVRRTDLPTDSKSVWAYSILEAPFVHPTVMIRAAVFRDTHNLFDEGVINQDFDLWSRLLPTRKGANLPDVLLYYRVHGDNMTIQRAEPILDSTVNIICRRLDTEGISDWLRRETIVDFYRYLFADRRDADRLGVDRLAISRRYWSFCRRLYRERGVGRPFLHAAVRRVVQSGVWPNGLERFFARMILMAELAVFAPDAVARLASGVPGFLGRRLS